jgi:hypothetical protein
MSPAPPLLEKRAPPAAWREEATRPGRARRCPGSLATRSKIQQCMSKGKYSCYNIVYRSVITMHKTVLQLCIIVSKRADNCSNDVYKFFVIISATSTFTLTHWLHQDLKYTAASNAKQVMEVVDVTCVSHHWPLTPNGEEFFQPPYITTKAYKTCFYQAQKP